MTFALWCILVAGLLPFLWSTLSKSEGRYDNSQPRLQQKTGWRQRADWAQQNAWEAFAPFAAGVLVAHWAHAGQATVDTLAGVFILCRIGHGLAYIGDKPTLRSLVWTAGLFCVVGLYVAAAKAG